MVKECTVYWIFSEISDQMFCIEITLKYLIHTNFFGVQTDWQVLGQYAFHCTDNSFNFLIIPVSFNQYKLFAERMHTFKMSATFLSVLLLLLLVSFSQQSYVKYHEYYIFDKTLTFLAAFEKCATLGLDLTMASPRSEESLQELLLV